MDREEIIEVLKNEVEKFVDFHDWDLAKRTVALYTGFHMVNEFENKFNQLESENKQLREECEWISVDDRLPVAEVKGAKCARYYVNFGAGYGENMILYFFFVEQVWTQGYGDTQKGITHWRPLPKPPQDSKQ